MPKYIKFNSFSYSRFICQTFFESSQCAPQLISDFRSRPYFPGQGYRLTYFDQVPNGTEMEEVSRAYQRPCRMEKSGPLQTAFLLRDNASREWPLKIKYRERTEIEFEYKIITQFLSPISRSYQQIDALESEKLLRYNIYSTTQNAVVKFGGLKQLCHGTDSHKSELNVLQNYIHAKTERCFHIPQG